MRVLITRVLRVLFPAKPKQVGPREYGSTTYKGAAKVPVDLDGDRTTAISKDDIDRAHRSARDGFPTQPATPRHRRDVPTGWARVRGVVTRRGNWPTDNQGRFR